MTERTKQIPGIVTDAASDWLAARRAFLSLPAGDNRAREALEALANAEAQLAELVTRLDAEIAE